MKSKFKIVSAIVVIAAIAVSAFVFDGKSTQQSPAVAPTPSEFGSDTINSLRQ